MKWFAILLAVMIVGCSPTQLQIQAATANGIAHAANSELPVLVAQFDKAGIAVIDHVKATGGTEEDAHKALAVVEHEWAPLWAAWTALRIAHEAWADALEGHGSLESALKAMQAAYCQVIFLWPKDVPALPVAPVRCSP